SVTVAVFRARNQMRESCAGRSANPKSAVVPHERRTRRNADDSDVVAHRCADYPSDPRAVRTSRAVGHDICRPRVARILTAAEVETADKIGIGKIESNIDQPDSNALAGI